MKIINLNQYDELQFLNQLEKINFKENISFLLNKQVSKNIQIFFNFLIQSNIKKITLIKDQNFDLLSSRILKKYFNKNINSIYDEINIHFKKFKQEEILEFLDYRFLLFYFGKNNQKIVHDKKYFEKKNFILNKNLDLINKYKTFQIFADAFKKYPFTSLTFPKEKGSDRLVYYFRVYSEKSKKEFLKLIDKLNNKNSKIKELIISNKVYEEIDWYGLGLNYKNNKLKRITLYSSFLDSSKNIKNITLVNSKHNLNLDLNLKNIWGYGIDFYDDYEEIKIYSIEKKYIEFLDDKEINDILNKILISKVLKYRNGVKINEKYEFNISNLNKSQMKKIIGEENENLNTLAIYFKNNKILKKILYEV